MKSHLILLALLLWIVTPLSHSFAQTANTPTMYGVWQNEIEPSMTLQYEEVAKKQLALLKKHNLNRSLYVYQLDNNHYWWICAFDDMADYEQFGQEWKKFVQNTKEEGFIFDKDFGKYDDFVKPMIFMSVPDLSYTPEKDNATPNNYNRWGFCYVKFGYESEFQQNWNKWVNLFTDNNIEIGWSLYTGIVGTENPMYIWTEEYENPLDMETKRAKAFQKIGEQSDKLWLETMSYMRKIDFVTGWFRLDLSYIVED